MSIIDPEMPRTGADLEKFGIERTPVGKQWKTMLEVASLQSSPIDMLCDPLTRKLWRAYADVVRKSRRKAGQEMYRRYDLIIEIAKRMPEEATFMDLLNWIYELESVKGFHEFADDVCRGTARDIYQLEFVERELIGGQGVG